MLEIVWSDEAGSDVVEIVSYIARRNPAAARRMRSLITNSVLPTSEFQGVINIRRRSQPGWRIGRIAGRASGYVLDLDASAHQMML